MPLGPREALEIYKRKLSLSAPKDTVRRKQQRKNYLLKFGVFFDSLLSVLRRSHWTFFLIVFFFAGITAISAEKTLFLLIGLMFLIGAITAHALGSNENVDSWVGIIGGFLSLAFAAFAASVGFLIIHFSRKIASMTGGDENVTLSLLCALCLTIVPMVAMRYYTAKISTIRISSSVEKDNMFPETKKEFQIRQLHEKRLFWKECVFNVSLICTALIPAALPASWFWNVLASVVLPVLALSVKNAYAKHSTTHSRRIPI